MELLHSNRGVEAYVAPDSCTLPTEALGGVLCQSMSGFDIDDFGYDDDVVNF